jgi:hypothetical protein
MGVNAKAALFLTLALLPMMAPGASVIFLSSVHGAQKLGSTSGAMTDQAPSPYAVLGTAESMPGREGSSTPPRFQISR